MVSSCYVCQQTSDTEPKVYMFKPNKNNLQEWHECIGRHDRRLKVSHKICENHFRADDIVRYDIFMISGKEIKLPKIIPVLKPGAQPLKWDKKTTSKKVEKNDTQPLEIEIPSCDMTDIESPIFSYDQLMSQIDEVLLPSDEWAAHRNGKVVSFVHVSYENVLENLIMDKVVIFTNSLTPVCTFNGIKSDLQVLCSSVDAISGVLKYVDSAQLCTVQEPKRNCKGYVLAENTEQCSNCSEDQSVLRNRRALKRKK